MLIGRDRIFASICIANRVIVLVSVDTGIGRIISTVATREDRAVVRYRGRWDKVLIRDGVGMDCSGGIWVKRHVRRG